MSVKMRQEVERKIIRQVVDDLLAAGFRLTVSLERGYDVDDCLLGSTDADKIVEATVAGDECHIFVHAATGRLMDENKCLDSIGWIYFVYGNDGWDVISDYTTNLEPHLANANKISDHYSN